jgi:hypothetical protein
MQTLLNSALDGDYWLAFSLVALKPRVEPSVRIRLESGLASQWFLRRRKGSAPVWYRTSLPSPHPVTLLSDLPRLYLCCLPLQTDTEYEVIHSCPCMY